MQVIIIHDRIGNIGPFENDDAATAFANRHFSDKGDHAWDLDVLRSPQVHEQQTPERSSS